MNNIFHLISYNFKGIMFNFQHVQIMEGKLHYFFNFIEKIKIMGLLLMNLVILAYYYFYKYLYILFFIQNLLIFLTEFIKYHH